jgi:hypothetical protein
MADGRKNNGNKGHSTKPKNPNDKRLSGSKELLEKYINEDFDYKKFKNLMDKMYSLGTEGDTKATDIFLNRILGRPEQKTDITSNGKDINIPLSTWADDSKES